MSRAVSGWRANPLWGLAPFFRPHRMRLVEIMACLAVKLVCDLVIPWSLKVLIDDIIPRRDVSLLAWWFLIVVASVLLGSAASYRWSLVSGWTALEILNDLRARCMEKLYALPLRFYTSATSGDLLAQATADVEELQGIVGHVLPVMLYEAATLATMAAFAMVLNGMLAAVVLLAGAPLFAFVYFRMNDRLQTSSRQLQDAKGALTGVISEQLMNQFAIKTFRLERWAASQLAKAVETVSASTRSVVSLDAMLTGSTNLVFLSVRVIVLAVGAMLVVHGRITVGALVAFATLVSSLLAPFITIADQFSQTQMAAGAFGRIAKLLDLESEDDGSAPRLPALSQEIRFDDVTVRHSGDIAALHRVSVTIPAGTFVAVVGPSGSGKSTFINLLARLYDPDAGRILFDGRDIRNYSRASLRDQIAFCPQNPIPFNITVGENVRLGRPSASRNETLAALMQAGMDCLAELGAEGQDTPSGELGQRLSGGQRQRIALARALIREAPLLLLDEPTASLHGTAEDAILSALAERRRRGDTIVFVTHRIAAAAKADLILVFDRGRLVEQGTSEDLRQRRGHYWRLVDAAARSESA